MAADVHVGDNSDSGGVGSFDKDDGGFHISDGDDG